MYLRAFKKTKRKLIGHNLRKTYENFKTNIRRKSGKLTLSSEDEILICNINYA